jgi:hypothetical protein
MAHDSWDVMFSGLGCRGLNFRQLSTVLVAEDPLIADVLCLLCRLSYLALSLCELDAFCSDWFLRLLSSALNWLLLCNITTSYLFYHTWSLLQCRLPWNRGTPGRTATGRQSAAMCTVARVSDCIWKQYRNSCYAARIGAVHGRVMTFGGQPVHAGSSSDSSHRLTAAAAHPVLTCAAELSRRGLSGL